MEMYFQIVLRLIRENHSIVQQVLSHTVAVHIKDYMSEKRATRLLFMPFLFLFVVSAPMITSFHIYL